MLGNETVSCFSFLFHKPSGTGDSNRRSGGQNRPSGDSSPAHWAAHKQCERRSKFFGLLSVVFTSFSALLLIKTFPMAIYITAK